MEFEFLFLISFFFLFFHDSFEMLFEDEFPVVLMVSVDRLVRMSILIAKKKSFWVR